MKERLSSFICRCDYCGSTTDVRVYLRTQGTTLVKMSTFCQKCILGEGFSKLEHLEECTNKFIATVGSYEEKVVLGGMLIDNGIIPHAKESLRRYEFIKPIHREIFEAEIALYGDGDGNEVDAVAVRDYLRAKDVEFSVAIFAEVLDVVIDSEHTEYIIGCLERETKY